MDYNYYFYGLFACFIFTLTLAVNVFKSEAALLRLLLAQMIQSLSFGSQITTSHSIIIASLVSTNWKLSNWNPAKTQIIKSIKFCFYQMGLD